MAEDETDTCVWMPQFFPYEDDVWESSCEADPWLFATGGPADNNMRFCPFCGRRLEVKEASNASQS